MFGPTASPSWQFLERSRTLPGGRARGAALMRRTSLLSLRGLSGCRHGEALLHHQLTEQRGGTLVHFRRPLAVFVAHPEGSIERRPPTPVLHVKLDPLFGQISDQGVGSPGGRHM